MKSYLAAFSAPLVDTPFAGGERWLPGLYCLYGTGHSQQVMCDRYEWDPASGKPWWGDQPADTHSLHDLVGGYDLFTDGGTGNLLDAGKPVDAALCLGDVSTVYLFQGGNCITFSINNPSGSRLKTQGFTRSIKDVFGYDSGDGNGKVFAFGSVDAALYSPNDHKIWFFDGSQCVPVADDNYQWNRSQYPVPISTAWSGLTADFTNGIAWAATTNVTTAQKPDGAYQDSGYFVENTNWCAVHPTATTTTGNGGALCTDPGDPRFSIPNNATQITLELWGPGGNGGYSMNGGNGGAGAYIRQTTTALPGPSGVHIGAPGDCTYFYSNAFDLIAGGGGNGGNGGGYGSYGSDGDSPGGGGNGGSGAGGNGGAGSSGSAGSRGGPGGNGGGASGRGAGRGIVAGGAGGPGGKGVLGSLGYGGNGGDGGNGGAGGGAGGAGGAGGGAGYDADGSGGGGGGGAQGASVYPDGAVFKPCSDSDSRLPYNQLADGSGAGGHSTPIGTPTPGGNGAARISWSG